MTTNWEMTNRLDTLELKLDAFKRETLERLDALEKEQAKAHDAGVRDCHRIAALERRMTEVEHDTWSERGKDGVKLAKPAPAANPLTGAMGAVAGAAGLTTGTHAPSAPQGLYGGAQTPAPEMPLMLLLGKKIETEAQAKMLPVNTVAESVAGVPDEKNYRLTKVTENGWEGSFRPGKLWRDADMVGDVIISIPFAQPQVDPDVARAAVVTALRQENAELKTLLSDSTWEVRRLRDVEAKCEELKAEANKLKASLEVREKEIKWLSECSDAEEVKLRDAVVKAALAWDDGGANVTAQLGAACTALRAHRMKVSTNIRPSNVKDTAGVRCVNCGTTRWDHCTSGACLHIRAGAKHCCGSWMEGA